LVMEEWMGRKGLPRSNNSAIFSAASFAGLYPVMPGAASEMPTVVMLIMVPFPPAILIK
jgi:hypothetical protein